eukprot:3702058-Karenia_brevis.AAC.1
MWRSGIEGVDGEPRSKTIKQSNPVMSMGEGASMPQLEVSEEESWLWPPLDEEKEEEQDGKEETDSEEE